MEVKIGIENSGRELTVDTNEDREKVAETIAAGLRDGSLIELTDSRGRAVLIPGSKVTYVEIGGGAVGAVGFRS